MLDRRGLLMEATFDPALFIAEMRQAGFTVVPTWSEPVGSKKPTHGSFCIRWPRRQAIPGAARAVEEKWFAAVKGTPDALQAVYRVLTAAEAPLASTQANRRDFEQDGCPA